MSRWYAPTMTPSVRDFRGLVRPGESGLDLLPLGQKYQGSHASIPRLAFLSRFVVNNTYVGIHRQDLLTFLRWVESSQYELVQNLDTNEWILQQRPLKLYQNQETKEIEVVGEIVSFITGAPLSLSTVDPNSLSVQNDALDEEGFFVSKVHFPESCHTIEKALNQLHQTHESSLKCSLEKYWLYMLFFYFYRTNVWIMSDNNRLLQDKIKAWNVKNFLGGDFNSNAENRRHSDEIETLYNRWKSMVSIDRRKMDSRRGINWAKSIPPTISFERYLAFQRTSLRCAICSWPFDKPLSDGQSSTDRTSGLYHKDESNLRDTLLALQQWVKDGLKPSDWWYYCYRWLMNDCPRKIFDFFAHDLKIMNRIKLFAEGKEAPNRVNHIPLHHIFYFHYALNDLYLSFSYFLNELLLSLYNLSVTSRKIKSLACTTNSRRYWMHDEPS